LFVYLSEKEFFRFSPKEFDHRSHLVGLNEMLNKRRRIEMLKTAMD
jgi:hypothetical protein